MDNITLCVGTKPERKHALIYGDDSWYVRHEGYDKYLENYKDMRDGDGLKQFRINVLNCEDDGTLIEELGFIEGVVIPAGDRSNFASDCGDYSFFLMEHIIGPHGHIRHQYLTKNATAEDVVLITDIYVFPFTSNHDVNHEVFATLPDLITHDILGGKKPMAIFLKASNDEVLAECGYESEEYIDACASLSGIYGESGYVNVKREYFVYDWNNHEDAHLFDWDKPHEKDIK